MLKLIIICVEIVPTHGGCKTALMSREGVAVTILFRQGCMNAANCRTCHLASQMKPLKQSS